MRNLYQLGFSAAVLIVLATGCSTYESHTRDMTAAWVGGRPQFASEQFAKAATKHDNGKDSIVWHLEAGASARAIGNYQLSNQHFDTAANQIDAYEQKAKVKIGHEAAAILSNQANLPYEGRSYDKIMLHTFKALNYLELGEPDKARPELIRAYQRQQDAVEENKKRIEKAREEEAKCKDREQIEKAKADPTFAQSVAGLSKGFEGFKFYSDYVNPFTVYLDGLYFLYAGVDGSDLERALKSLKRVAEITGDNKFVQADLATAENVVKGQPVPPTTYVIVENGSAASRDQIRIDIPIIITDVSYIGAAFPTLVFHNDEAAQFRVQAGSVEETALPVANMDSIVAQDFKNELPAIITKTMISTISKGVAAYALNHAASREDDILGLLVRIGTAAAQASVNIADTRSWSTLPKEFEVMRVPTPANRKIVLFQRGGASATIDVAPGTINVVYVKSISASSPLLVSQFKLK